MPDGDARRLDLGSASGMLDRFRTLHGIDGRYDASRTWPFRIGPLIVPVPNFGWRRSAIRRHDIHHLVTGYPFNMRGEFQVATWEFAAGRYPHAGATLLILPLVTLGLFWSPRAIWRAFLDGRRSISLYRPEFAIEDQDLSWQELLDRVKGHRARPIRSASLADRLAFLRIVLQSAAIVTGPVAAIATSWLLI